MAQNRRASEARDLREDIRREHSETIPGVGEGAWRAEPERTGRRGSVALVRAGDPAMDPSRPLPGVDPDAERPSGIYARRDRDIEEVDESLEFPTPLPYVAEDDFRDLSHDPELDRIWRRRRPRRALVKTLGWAMVAGAVALLALMATTEPAASGMGEWASFGLLDRTPPAWAAPAPDPDLALLLRGGR